MARIDGLGPAGARRRVHAVSFEAAGDALTAVRRLRREGFEVHDVHTPFPVHGMEEALGLPPSRLGLVTLVGGLLGGTVAFAFQAWTHAIDWPLVIGGKSPLALPAQVPVGFELTILFASLAAALGLLVRAGLFPRKEGRPASQPHPAVTDDRFVLLVVERDGGFSMSRLRAVLETLHPVEVVEGWRVL